MRKWISILQILKTIFAIRKCKLVDFDQTHYFAVNCLNIDVEMRNPDEPQAIFMFIAIKNDLNIASYFYS
jgi:hypothetical protein